MHKIYTDCYLSHIVIYIMNLRFSHFFFYLYILVRLTTPCFSTEVPDNKQLKNNEATINTQLSRVIISNTEEKLNNLTFGKNSGTILIQDVAALNDKSLSDLLKNFWGKPITQSLLKSLSMNLEKFLHNKGFNKIYIDYPNYTHSGSDLKILVILNVDLLKTLYLTTPELANKPYLDSNRPSEVIVENLPKYLIDQDFSYYVTNYFSKPITPDYVNKLIYNIAKYIKTKGSYLAVAQIPQQNVQNGVLKMGLVIGNYPLHRLVIMGSPEKDATTPIAANAGTVIALNNKIYSTPEFTKYISVYIGKPITVELLDELKDKLILYGKNHDRIIIDATRTYIDLPSGEVKIGVVVGKYSQLHIKGNRWFSDELLEKQLGIKSGDEISLTELDNAIAWENRNPFLQVQVALDTLNQPIGQADLDIDVREVTPVRLSASYSNSINSPLGNSSYSSSAQFGNLFNAGQELNLQYSTNNTPKYYQAYSLDYKVPLLWHDYLRTDMAYTLAYPQSILGYKGLNQKAKNTVVDIRYLKPITRGNWTFEFSAGVDYKQVNTNLEFGLFREPMSVYDIAELVLGTTVIKKDSNGSWSLGTNINLSPGGINFRNSESSFQTTPTGGITGDCSRYVYGKIILERNDNLPWSFQTVSRVTVQGSSSNLQGSEQILIGGGASVRGYAQNYTGDQGFIFNQELRSPYFQNKLPFTHVKNRKINTQLIAFLDYGRVEYKHPKQSDISLPTLMGTGIGLRSSLFRYFNMGSDLSWPLIRPTYSDPHPTKGTFWMTLAY